MGRNTSPGYDRDDLLASAMAAVSRLAQALAPLRDGVAGLQASLGRAATSALDGVDPGGGRRLLLVRGALWALGMAIGAAGILAALATIAESPAGGIPLPALLVSGTFLGFALLGARELLAFRSRLMGVAGLDGALGDGAARVACAGFGALIAMIVAGVLGGIVSKTRPMDGEEVLFLALAPAFVGLAVRALAYAYRDRLAKAGHTVGGAIAVAMGVSGAVCAVLLLGFVATRPLAHGMDWVSVVIAALQAAAVAVAGFANMGARRRRDAGARAFKGFAGASLLALGVSMLVPWTAFVRAPAQASTAWGILILILPVVLIVSVSIAFAIATLGWRFYRAAFACAQDATGGSGAAFASAAAGAAR